MSQVRSQVLPWYGRPSPGQPSLCNARMREGSFQTARLTSLNGWLYGARGLQQTLPSADKVSNQLCDDYTSNDYYK